MDVELYRTELILFNYEIWKERFINIPVLSFLSNHSDLSNCFNKNIVSIKKLRKPKEISLLKWI